MTAAVSHMKTHTPTLTELFRLKEEGHPLKVCCASCRQKLDMTALEPFSVIQCPICSAEVKRPVYFGDFLLEEPVCRNDVLTSVYRAYDVKLGRHVALKFLNPEYAASKAIRDRYLEIARIIASLNHSSVISVYNCGIQDGFVYVVTHFTEYGTLDEYLASRSDSLSLELTVSWASELLSALRKGAASGVFHGAVNPSHVLVDSSHCLKLTGFGSAELYRIAGIVGEDPCASPETRIHGTVNERSDIYSLGVLLYRLLTGRYPVAGKDGEWIPPVKLRRECQGMLSETVCRMLAVDPAQRPNVEEALRSFEAVHAGMEYAKLDRKRKNSSRLRGDFAIENAGRCRSVLFWIGGMILVLLIIIGIGFLLYMRNR